MSKHLWLMVALFVLPCSQGLRAQTLQTYSLSELFRLADEHSKRIESYATGKAAADEAVKAAKAQRLPDIGASVSVSYLGNGYLTDRDFSDGMKIDMPHYGNNFALEAQQVVYAGGAISSGIALAELGQQMARLDLEKNRQEVRFLLTGYYLNLYKLDNQVTVLLKNLDLTEQVIRHMEARRTQGTVLKNDITRYELQRERVTLQLAQARDARRVMNHYLVSTLHLPADTQIVPDSTLIGAEVNALAEQEWQQLATAGNLGLRQAELAVRMSEQRVKLERSEQLPKVALVAIDHLDGPITVEVPAIDKNFNYFYLGVGVRYNLSSLYKSNRRVRQARLEARRAQEQHELAQEEVENAVQAAYVNFLTTFTDLRTQEKSVQLADENYAVTDNRYRNGLVLLTDMLDASNTKLASDLSLVNARINVIFNYYKMKYITHSL